MAENERLAVVEVEVRGLRDDMTEVKSDLKFLISAVATLTAHEEATAKAAAARAEAEGRIGVWARAAIPWVLSGIGICLTILGLLDILGEH